MPSRTSHQTAVLLVVLISYLMIVLDISIVITGLPKIQAGLGFSTAALSWVQNAYTLTFGGLLLLGARAGDIFGRRRTFVAGLGLFTLASGLIGAAQSPAWLLAARALQGVGAAILAPSTLALLTTSFAEGPERTRAVGYYGAVAGIGASIGLVVGGLFADLVSWRAGFFINLPIGVALAWGALRYLPETTPRPGRFDVAGALLSTLGMTALVYGIVRSATHGWQDTGTLVAVIGGVALLIALVVNEWRAAEPIMPLRLFAHHERAAAYLARALFLGAMVSFWFFTTQILQTLLGYRPAQAGLAFLPTTLPNFAVALAVPRLAARFGYQKILIVGLVFSILGMIGLSRVDVNSSYILGVAIPMVLIGIGQGLSLAPLTVSGVAGVQPIDAGAASGLVNVAHQLGGSLGLAALVAVFAWASKGTAGHAAFVTGTHSAFIAGAVLCAIALLVVLSAVVRGASGSAANPTVPVDATDI